MRKVSLLILSFCFMAVLSFGQSVRYYGENKAAEASTQELSKKHVMFATDVTQSFTKGVNDLKNSNIFSLKGIYTLKTKNENIGLPIMGNFDLNTGITNIVDILSSDGGLGVGFYPWFVTGPNFTVHGGINTRLFLSDTSYSVAPNAVRLYGGVEYEKSGFVLSLTPGFQWTKNFAEVGNFTFIEVTGIIPVAANLGLMVEWTAPFKDGVNSMLRAGLVIRP